MADAAWKKTSLVKIFIGEDKDDWHVWSGKTRARAQKKGHFDALPRMQR
jgi:hypothetical protein